MKNFFNRVKVGRGQEDRRTGGQEDKGTGGQEGRAQEQEGVYTLETLGTS